MRPKRIKERKVEEKEIAILGTKFQCFPLIQLTTNAKIKRFKISNKK